MNFFLFPLNNSSQNGSISSWCVVWPGCFIIIVVALWIEGFFLLWSCCMFSPLTARSVRLYPSYTFPPLVGVNFSFPSGVFVSFFAGTFQGIFSKEIKSFKITTFPVQSNSSFWAWVDKDARNEFSLGVCFRRDFAIFFSARLENQLFWVFWGILLGGIFLIFLKFLTKSTYGRVRILIKTGLVTKGVSKNANFNSKKNKGRPFWVHFHIFFGDCFLYFLP